MKRDIQGSQRLPRMLAFRVTGTGTAVVDEGTTDGTLVDNGTGDYTLTFVNPFTRVPAIAVTSLTTDVYPVIAGASATGVNVKTFQANDGTTATDGVFHALVLGWDTADIV